MQLLIPVHFITDTFGFMFAAYCFISDAGIYLKTALAALRL